MRDFELDSASVEHDETFEDETFSPTAIDPGRLFDAVVHRGVDARVMLPMESAGEADEAGAWEVVARPRSTVRPQDLPPHALVVRRALGEGRLATLQVLDQDVARMSLYARDGRIRPDVLIIILRRLTPVRPLRRSRAILITAAQEHEHEQEQEQEQEQAPEQDLSFLRWSPDSRAGRFPARPKSAIGGRAFLEKIKGERTPATPADWVTRENAMVAELIAGNMPDGQLRWITVNVTHTGKKGKIDGTIEVLPDYLSVGHDGDYVHVPLDPVSAQFVADKFDTILPTAKICHAIYLAASAKNKIGAITRDYYFSNALRKLTPRDRAQDSTASYLEHTIAIQARMKERGLRIGELVAGHKKDVVVAQRLHAQPEKIAFQGFYDDKGFPREPCYENKENKPQPGCNKEHPTLAHSRRFSDYSQGVRLVNPWMTVNGERKMVATVLADPELAFLISTEGPITPPRIPRTVKPPLGTLEALEDAGEAEDWGEVAETPALEHGDFGEAVPLGGRGRFRHEPLAGDAGDNVELRWNADAATRAGSTLDIVVYLHGYGTPRTDFIGAKAAAAGVDLVDATGAIGVRTSRPTIVLVPRGRSGGGSRWFFDTLKDTAAFDALIKAGLAWFCESVLRLPSTATLARGRLTLVAHSGGGAGMSALLKSGVDPDEVVCFDSIYGNDDPIRRWAEAKIASPRAGKSGLRVFYTACDADSWSYWKSDGRWHLSSTEVSSRRLHQALGRALAKSTNAAALTPRFRVERTSVGHNDIPARYSPRLLDDIAATMPQASAPPPARTRPVCVANDDWLTQPPQRAE